MRKIDRFDKYMKLKGLNDNKVTIQLGLSVGLLGKSRKEGRDLSDKVIEDILNFYTDIDRVWLLTGVGDKMLKDEKNSPISDSTSISQFTETNTGNANLMKIISKLFDEKKQLFEQNQKLQNDLVDLQRQVGSKLSDLFKQNGVLLLNNQKLQDDIINLQKQISSLKAEPPTGMGIIPGSTEPVSSGSDNVTL